MTERSSSRFPSETDDYRRAREQLLTAEQQLRRQVEEVAAMRRALPGGNTVDPPFITTTGFSADSDSPMPVANGIQPGQWLTIIFTLQGTRTPVQEEATPADDGTAVEPGLGDDGDAPETDEPSSLATRETDSISLR